MSPTHYQLHLHADNIFSPFLSLTPYLGTLEQTFNIFASRHIIAMRSMISPQQPIYRQILVQQRPIDTIARWRNLKQILLLKGSLRQQWGKSQQWLCNLHPIHHQPQKTILYTNIFNNMILIHNRYYSKATLLFTPRERHRGAAYLLSAQLRKQCLPPLRIIQFFPLNKRDKPFRFHQPHIPRQYLEAQHFDFRICFHGCIINSSQGMGKRTKTAARRGVAVLL